jgi:hypothetical protein
VVICKSELQQQLWGICAGAMLVIYPGHVTVAMLTHACLLLLEQCLLLPAFHDCLHLHTYTPRKTAE